MSDFLVRARQILSDSSLLLNEPLSLHSSFRIGGEADYFAKPESEEAFTALLSAAGECGVPYCVIGCASNILFSDKGFRGVVISTLGLKNIDINGNLVRAGAGVTMPVLSSRAQKNSLDGMRFMCGIPGTVGGGVFMKAGAYGGEIACILTSSRYYDTEKGEIFSLSASEHDFGYRHSSYMEHNERVLLSADFSLTLGNPDEIKAECEELLRRRAEKQPLEFPSAGSTFKRPEGYFAGKLIQDAGLSGYKVGGAMVSTKHAGFVINAGGATAQDIYQLIQHIQKTVNDKFQVELEPEVRFLGEF